MADAPDLGSGGRPCGFKSHYPYQRKRKGRSSMRKFLQKYLKYVVLAAALAACLYGASRGEMNTVYHKAAAICMECIGIG